MALVIGVYLLNILSEVCDSKLIPTFIKKGNLLA